MISGRKTYNSHNRNPLNSHRIILVHQHVLRFSLFRSENDLQLFPQTYLLQLIYTVRIKYALRTADCGLRTAGLQGLTYIKRTKYSGLGIKQCRSLVSQSISLIRSPVMGSWSDSFIHPSGRLCIHLLIHFFQQKHQLPTNSIS